MGCSGRWRRTTLWQYVIRMKKILLFLLFFIISQISHSKEIFDQLEKSKKTSYLDFVLLKIENRLIQRRGLLGAQAIAFRIQYQQIGSEVNFLKEESKIEISIVGVMDKRRYEQKKYKPKISDCNVLRNILLYGKYGYNVIFQKKNTHLTPERMKDIFMSRFLNNLTLSNEEKDFIVENTIAEVRIIDPVRNNDILCKGLVAQDLK